MKSNPNEPESAPRRAEKGWVVLAWAVAGFLLGNLILQPQPPAPSAPIEERSAAAPKDPAPVEASYLDRPGRERPESRDRIYRDLGDSFAPPAPSPAALAQPVAQAAAQTAPAPASEPLPQGPGELMSQIVNEPSSERPGRPEGRPESRERDQRESPSYSD